MEVTGLHWVNFRYNRSLGHGLVIVDDDDDDFIIIISISIVLIIYIIIIYVVVIMRSLTASAATTLVHGCLHYFAARLLLNSLYWLAGCRVLNA